MIIIFIYRFGNYNYDIYSGLLNVTATGSRKIHYILVESQSDPLNDPLVIWVIYIFLY